MEPYRIYHGGTGGPGTEPPPVSLLPIALDLNGDGLVFVDRDQSGHRMDVDGDGYAEDMAWVGSGDAVLVHDANGNGIVDSAAEITLADYAVEGGTDLDGLKTFDSNGDGVFDSRDAAYDEFALWVDANGDGTFATDEVVTLAEAGIESIDLNGTPNGRSVNGTTIHNDIAATLADGSVVAGADAEFSASSRGSVFEDLEDGSVLERFDDGTGALSFGRGRDVFLFSEFDDAEIIEASGGRGQDTLINDTGRDSTLSGDQGRDTLIGGTGTDFIDGGRGRDVIEGNAGWDVLKGGAGRDTFVFGSDSDVDIVTDFDVARDTVQLDLNRIDGFDALMAYARADGSGTVLDFGDGNELHLMGVDRNDLRADHFEFI